MAGILIEARYCTLREIVIGPGGPASSTERESCTTPPACDPDHPESKASALVRVRQS